MADSPDLNQMFQDVYDTLEQSVRTLNSGGSVQANLLQDKAKLICEILAQLPPKEARAYEAQLKTLVEHFSTVSNRLQHQQDSIQDEVGTINYRHAVKGAYQNAASLQNPPPTSEEDS